jgi:tRNA(adenine34) deaminase
MGINDAYWMQQAYLLAQQAGEAGEVPVGAVVVDANNQLIGTGYNQSIQAHDPTAHAEVIALRRAAQCVQNYRLNQATLYVTLEPCTMCAGALIQARIARLVFATRDVQAGAAGSVFNFLQSPSLNHTVEMDDGVMEHACAALLHDFFKARRFV